MDILLKYLVDEQLTRAINEYGIEGTEEAIKRVYTQNKEIKIAMLNGLKDRIKR